MHLWTAVKSAIDGRTRYLQGTVSQMADSVVTIRTFLTHGSSAVGRLGIDAAGNTVIAVNPWLASEGDRQTVVDWIQWWLDLTNGTASIAANIASNSTLAYTDATATPDSIIAAKLISGDHWVGTARMGTDDGRVNGTAVVDLDTKVYGTDNLFVVDASIHPDLPTGNTQSIVMIVAEHAAEKIIDYQVCQSAT